MSLASHPRGLDLIAGQSVLYLLWTRWCWSRFISEYFCFPPSGSLYRCSVCTFICLNQKGKEIMAGNVQKGTPVSKVGVLGTLKYFHFFFSPHKTWHWNRIFSEKLDLPPSLSFCQCFILILILLLLYQKGELVKPGNLQKAILFSKITEHWIEKYFHFFSHRPCHG